MTFNENPYSRRELKQNKDPRIPEYVLDMAFDQYVMPHAIPELLQYECEKTEDFEEIINGFNNGYKRLVENLGLDIYQIDTDKIHIIYAQALLDYKEYELPNSPKDDAFGFIHDGHMYVRDDLPFVTFLIAFSHEYMHLVSNQRKEVEVFVNEDNPYEIFGSRYSREKSGVFQAKTDAKGTKLFGTGFDEALTELFALELRRLSDFPEELEQEAIDYLHDDVTTYFGQADLVKKIFEKYFNEEFTPDSEHFKDLLRLYIAEDPKFLNDLQEKFKDNNQHTGLKILYSMDVNSESANKCAKELGLDIK